MDAMVREALLLPGGRGLLSLLGTLCRFSLSAGSQAQETLSAPGAEALRNQRAAALLDRHGSSVLRCAYAYFHNLSDAEEILQETLIRYLEAAPDLTDADHEKAWLLRVAANLCKNKLRYNRLRETDQLSAQIAAEGREDLSFVWEAVKALPVHERAAVHLFYAEGYSTREIGEILRRKESTVRSDLRRGRLHLRALLKEGYDLA